MSEVCECLLISDFNIENLSNYLSAANDIPEIRPVLAPFGQVVPSLLQLRDAESHPDLCVIWTRPEAVLPSFADVLRSRRMGAQTLLGEVDQFCSALEAAREHVGCMIVCNWSLPPFFRGWGLLDLKRHGVARQLARINDRLAERLEDWPNGYLLNAQQWVQRVGEQAYNAQLWYLAKTPFSREVFRIAAVEIHAALRAVAGQTRKVIALDLDDTLWGGLVGEVGWESLKLGGHDPIGEAFLEFQQALKALQQRGALLVVVSKNEEEVALEALRCHPEMVLRPDDFAAWRINWNDKAEQLVQIAEELNLGLDSFVFIDDNPAERARVREALPEVLVPDWPSEKMRYREALLGLTCFDTATVSAEDRHRTGMYVAERKRRDFKRAVSSLDDWLSALQVHVRVQALENADLRRAVQLLNKTNQMNLTTRRLNQAELTQWLREGDRRFWCFRVSDRFGDSGLSGLASLEISGGVARVIDFVLSCRVFGRHVDRAMLHTLVEAARGAGCGEVRARYVPTPKNRVCLEFWKQSGFTCHADGTFCWKVAAHYPMPEFITLEEMTSRQADARTA